MKKVEIISRRRILDDFFKVEEAQLRYERYDGAMSAPVRRLRFERGDSAAALLIDPARRTVYLTEQFKYPTYGKGDGWIIEVVAGSMEEGETAKDCIRREILEEIGFEVAAIEPIADFFVSPGSSSERIFLFVARVRQAARIAKGGGMAAEGEDIKLVECSIDEFLGKLDTGSLKDAKTIIAAYWLKENKARLVRD